MAEALLTTSTAMDDDTESRVIKTTDSNGDSAADDERDTNKFRLSTHDHLISPTITDSSGNSAADDEHDLISAGRDEIVIADSTFDAKTCPSNADATGGLSNSNGAHIDHPSKDNHRPQVTPCSLNPAYWPRRRILVATIGCVSSVIVCTVRVLVDNDSFAYVLHSFIVLFDMILIHIFTYTPWLSIAGETTAITAAITYFFTHQRIFELLETTLIAVLVSIHMIQSRGEHWDREEGLEQDVIGLQLHIEQFLTNDVNRDLRRYSSLTIVNEDCDDRSSHAIEDARDLEIGGEANKVNFDVLSSINSTINPSVYDKEALRRQEQQRQVAVAAEIGEKSKVCFQHFFEHFLDGSAGVLYTSFFGLIVDEIIQFGIDK